MSSSGLNSDSEMLDDPSGLQDDNVPSQIKPPQTTSSTQVVKRVPSTEEMPPPASRPRKRSHEQSDDTTQSSVPSPDTAIADSAERKQFDTAVDSSTTAVTESAGNSQLQTSKSPPATPSSSTTAPRSAQGTPVPPRSQSMSQSKPVRAEKALNATSSKKIKQPKQKSSKNEFHNEPGHDDPASLGGPQDRIEDFDWDVLEQHYHDELQKVDEREAQIFGQFHHLVNLFGIWADTGARKEVDRGFKRVKTQMCYVQNEEDELEKKRQHYIRVVDAFKSALQLLTD